MEIMEQLELNYTETFKDTKSNQNPYEPEIVKTYRNNLYKQESLPFIKEKEDTTIIKSPDELDSESSLFYAIDSANDMMDRYGALYIFLRLNKQHQEDIENSFIALANGNG